MAKSVEWFQNTIKNISIDIDRVKYLEELKIALIACSESELSAIKPHLDLEPIFDCLNTTDKYQIELTIALLKKLFDVFDPLEIIKIHGRNLGLVLQHPEIEAKMLAINQLNRVSSNQAVLTLMVQETPIVLAAISCLKSEDLYLAKAAVSFLSEMGKLSGPPLILFQPDYLVCFKQLMGENDEIKFRVYEIVINISVHWKAGLEACIYHGLLVDLINEMKPDDILLQLTALELVTKLALKDYGLQFLQEKGLLKHLEEQLVENASLSGLLAPGYIKFFGNVAQTKPQEIFSKHPQVINFIFEHVDSNDPKISVVVLETIGFIASNPNGKEVLSQYDSKMQKVMRVIGEMLSLQPTDRKVVALNVLSNIIQLDIPDQTPELLLQTKNYFSQISENPAKTLKDICEKPFLELKLAGLVTLGKIVVQPWGQAEINKCPGFIEYLLDRNEEGGMNCKATKYNLVKSIIETPFAGNVFNSDVMDKFNAHVRQGVCYVQTRTVVAMEAE